MANRTGNLKGLLVGIGATLAALAVIGLFVVYTGAYNVAASEGHTAFTRWALDTTMMNSVQSRAGGARAPELTERMAVAGAREYKSMCEHCHGGPGVERAGWAEGMLPLPPYLVHAAPHWEPREVFWILQHGIKMSGMPAFGETHDAAALWNLTAFVTRLPAMSAQAYASYPAGEHSHGSGGAAHGEGGHAEGEQAEGGHSEGGHPEGTHSDGAPAEPGVAGDETPRTAG